MVTEEAPIYYLLEQIKECCDSWDETSEGLVIRTRRTMTCQDRELLNLFKRVGELGGDMLFDQQGTLLLIPQDVLAAAERLCRAQGPITVQLVFKPQDWLKALQLFKLIEHPQGNNAGYPLKPLSAAASATFSVSSTETEKTLSASISKENDIERELNKLKSHFGQKLSQNELRDSIRFLTEGGLAPEEISTKTGAGKSTVYRLLHEKDCKT